MWHRSGMFARALAILALLPFAAAQNASASPVGAPVGRGAFDPVRLQRIDELLAAEVANGHHAGLSYLLVHRGEVVASGAFGKADVATGAPMRRDSIVRIFSMSKPITAVAALTLVERGLLRLDQPIAELLPEFASPRVLTGGTAEVPETRPAGRKITVRMLLNHTAGFTYDFFHESPVDELYRRAELWQATSLDDFVARAAALPLLLEPGEQWHYSIADDVLGAVVERAAQAPLAEYVRRSVTAPLGMQDTDYDVAEAERARLAVVHKLDGGALVAAEPSFAAFAEPGRGFPAGGAGMFSTLDDYARFARFLLGDPAVGGGAVLSRKMLELLRTNSLSPTQHTSRPGDGWGLATAIYTDLGQGNDLGSAGTLWWSGAATTLFFADPQEQLVGVLFAQHMPYDQHKLLTRFRTAVYQALR